MFFAVTPEFRLIAVGDIAHDVGSPARSAVVEYNVPAEFFPVIAAERLFPFVFDVLVVRGDDYKPFRFSGGEFRFRRRGTEQERDGEDCSKQKQNQKDSEIHDYGFPFRFL